MRNYIKLTFLMKLCLFSIYIRIFVAIASYPFLIPLGLQKKVHISLRFISQGYATACLALFQLGMYSSAERSDLALAHEQPWVRSL